MKRPSNFFNITLADFIVRSGYQMGKTPLLPLFAAALGATGALLGLIVSVSTLTGMLLKPLIGVLSDRWGRRWWLLAGTAFFMGMPFLYRFVHSPEQLFALRLVHGLATAIYGPVSLALVAEQAQKKRAEKLGLFGMARHGGYIVGPALSGWLLLKTDPVGVFTCIGMLSCLALVPVLLLSDPVPRATTLRPSIRRQLVDALRSGARTSSVWLSGALEFTVFIALYSARAFLPLYALSLGLSVALVGAFFSIQEATHLVLRPAGGRLGDRLGYFRTIGLGLMVIGAALFLLTLAHGAFNFVALAILIGGAQALVFPSTVALVSTQVDERHLGAGMGLIGMLRNAGKVVGPILGGFLVHWLGFIRMFCCMSLLALLGAAVVWYWSQRRPRPAVPLPEGEIAQRSRSGGDVAGGGLWGGGEGNT